MGIKVLIAGAGPAGLISGYLLAKNGYEITLVEKSERIGGLLKTVQIDGIEIESVYHHILFNDSYLLKLINELNIRDRLRWYRSSVSLFTHQRFYDITTPLDYLSIDFLSFYNRLLLIKRLAFPREEAESLEKSFGYEIYHSFIEDMMVNKFGEFADRINLRWFIHKLRKRGRSRYIIYERLGYLTGSFREFYEKLALSIEKGNGKILTDSNIEKVEKEGRLFNVKINNKDYEFDKIIFTVSPYEIANLILQIDPDFSSRLLRLEYMSNITLLLYTARNLTDYYWINIADRNIKLTGIISQSNLVTYRGTKGFFTYLSLYLNRESTLLKMGDSDILNFFILQIEKMGINLDKSEIYDYKITRTEYAQPLFISEQDLILSKISTPVEDIFILNNHSILPDDRGLDNIVRMAESLIHILRG